MQKRSRKTWLFAFCDLAFLLLISLSLVPSSPDVTLRLAEMELPEVPDSNNLKPPPSIDQIWELRIFAVSDEHPVPFELKRADRDQGTSLDQQDLMAALQRLSSGERPQLLPEKSSLSQDFLFAAAAVAKVWSEPGHRAIVRPIPSGEAE